MLFDTEANDQAYKFWCKKTREKISDPKKRDILAPLKAPHAWGTKRYEHKSPHVPPNPANPQT